MGRMLWGRRTRAGGGCDDSGGQVATRLSSEELPALTFARAGNVLTEKRGNHSGQFQYRGMGVWLAVSGRGPCIKTNDLLLRLYICRQQLRNYLGSRAWVLDYL